MNLSRRRILLITWGLLLLPLMVGCLWLPRVVPEQLQLGVNQREGKSMRVSFERTGGFTGIPITITVDTNTLSPEEATQLCQLVEAADFFHLPAKIPSAAQPDRFQYKVAVVQNGQQHEVSVGELAVPSTLKPLLNWMMEAVRRQ